MTDITTKSLFELSQLFRDGSYSSREITDAFIAKIEAKNPEINAYVAESFDLAREMADAADARRNNKTLRSPLDGMPIALKDVVCTHNGVPTTACSKILKDFVSPYDATVWQKLQEAGVVLLGKVNTDEFTMGGSTETSCYGVTHNPYNLDCVAGGSSGGSAAAVAADMAPAALGTDTGGSIRQPAGFCNVTGLKVSYGRVSRYGVMPMASSLDTIGPIAKTPQDCAMLLQVMAGTDIHDATTPDIPVPNYLEELQKPLEGLCIGLPKEYYIDGIDEDVRETLNAARQTLEDLGVRFKEVSLPHTKYAAATYYVIAPSEVSANQARYDGVRFGPGAGGDNLEEIYLNARSEGFGAEVKRRIMIGTYALSAGYYDAYYRKAQKVRTLIKRDFEEAFKDVDALLTPVSPTPAFQIGQNTDDPVKMYLEDIFTIPASLAGIVGLSVPAGMSENGLPIGAQILCPAFKEERALRIGHHFYEAQQS